MELTSKIGKAKNRPKTTTNANNNEFISELRKVRMKNTRKTGENKLMVQLHHFANLTKSTTATKSGTLHLTAETKALLENDYFQVINPKNTEFVAKPFIINKNAGIDADFSPKIRCTASFNNNNNNNNNKRKNSMKRELKDLVAMKFKAKHRASKNPVAIACSNINALLTIKDYRRVCSKKVFETRLFINGLLVYDHLKQHYSGVTVARNCFRKKFVNQLNKATSEIFPELEPYKTTNDDKENRLMQKVMDYYENEASNVNVFNEQMIEIPRNIENNNNNNDNGECSSSPIAEYLTPESFGTPPNQRLIPIDLTATSPKYRTVYYEKDAQSGRASLFDVPPVNAAKINRCEFKRIDLFGDSGTATSTVKRRAVSGASSPPRNRPRKRLFFEAGDGGVDKPVFSFQPLRYENDEHLFVRPVYSPKEFTVIKRNQYQSPREFTSGQTLKVDEMDLYISDLSKIKTPEHRYYPFVQFNRK